MSSTLYDPTLRGLIALTTEDWIDPDEAAQHMVSFGINYVDQALYGMNFLSGELIGIQAAEKRRKSTMLANVVLNVAVQHTWWTCVDTLESGMPPKAYRDMLISIVATRLMIADVFGKNRKDWPPYPEIIQHAGLGSQLELCKEFLWFRHRTEQQHRAIEQAKVLLSALPITIFGPHPEQGNARNLPASINRWDKLYKGEWPEAIACEHRLFCSDHVQQYHGWESDYPRLEAVVNGHSDFVTGHSNTVVIDVSQLSVTSVRLERQNLGVGQAKGGAKLGAEVNVLFRTDYDKDTFPARMKISVEETRRRPPPPVFQELEPNSGAFLRPAYPAQGVRDGQ